MLKGIIDPDYQGAIGWLFRNGAKKDYVWRAGHPSGLLLVLPCPMINVNGKPQQFHPGKMTKSTEVQVTPPGKEPSPAEVLAEGRGLQNGGRGKWL